MKKIPNWDEKCRSIGGGRVQTFINEDGLIDIRRCEVDDELDFPLDRFSDYIPCDYCDRKHEDVKRRDAGVFLCKACSIEAKYDFE